MVSRARAQIAVFLGLLPVLESIPNIGLELLAVKLRAFAEEIESAALGGFDGPRQRLGVAGGAGEDDDFRIGPALLDLRQHFQTVRVLKLDIQQHHVRLFSRETLSRRRRPESASVIAY